MVLGFETLADAERVMAVLPKRIAKYGLMVHPEKTKLLNMRKPGEDHEPQSFTFLGFFHYWGSPGTAIGWLNERPIRAVLSDLSKR